MSSFAKALTLEQFANASLRAEDRRINARIKCLKSIRIRHLDSSHDEEVGTMTDLSRDGLYFIARSHHYRVGMGLRLSFPKTSSECTCEVVRIEQLPNGRLGVGVRILGW